MICVFLFISEFTSTESASTCSVSCEKITINQCRNILAYTQAGFPNFLGHTSNSEVTKYDTLITNLVADNCYAYTQNFLCGVLFPECDKENNGVILPTKTMCVDFMSGCGYLLETDNYQDVDSDLEIDCQQFPDPDNADPVCFPSRKYF